MIISAFFLFFLLASIFTQAQVNLDSLWGVWNDETAPDSSRALAMYKISWDGYLFSKPDSAFYFAQMLYDFASERNLKKEMANALNSQGISYYVRGDYNNALEYYQRSLNIYEKNVVGFNPLDIHLVLLACCQKILWTIKVTL